VLLITLGTAFLLGFFYMIFMRLCGGPIVYLSIVLMIAGTGYGGYMLYNTSLAMDPADKY